MAGIDIVDLFMRSSWMIRGVLLILAAMSLGSWSVIFLKLLQFSKAATAMERDISMVVRSRNLVEALASMAQTPESSSGGMARAALDELERMAGLKTMRLDGLRRVLRREAAEQSERLAGALPFLSTCASAGPLLGLFGTVWGIMHSFHGFKGLERHALSAIAPGLAEALSTTAMGLMVAIPAVLAYNYLLRRLARLERALARFEAELLNRVRDELRGP